jgi:hypothetical protein
MDATGSIDGDAPGDCGSELLQTIQGSSLNAAQKQSVYACLMNLKSSWCDGLANLFATSTPERIAAVLEELTMCCSRGSSFVGGEYSDAVQKQLLSGMLCPMPLYRGVAFPDD